LVKCEKEDFTLDINFQKLHEQYDFIQKARFAKGIPLTISNKVFVSL
jgi:hypothetical protein